jgi:hypothetical protein
MADEITKLRERVKNQSERLRFLEGPTNHAGGFSEQYLVAYTNKIGDGVLCLDTFKTYDLAWEFMMELKTSGKAFSTAGVLRFAVKPNVQGEPQPDKIL